MFYGLFEQKTSTDHVETNAAMMFIYSLKLG